MNKKIKGFTIVEILAVVVIIAILSIVVIPNITVYMESAEDDFNQNVKKQLLLAGKNYYSDYTERIPTNNSIKIADYVSAQELSSSGYTSKDYVDYKGNNCMEKSYVISYNEGNGVNYNACLICGNQSYIDYETEPYCDEEIREFDYDKLNQNLPTCYVDRDSIKTTIYGVKATVYANTTLGHIDDLYIIRNNKEKESKLSETEKGKYTEIEKEITITNYGINKVYIANGNRKILCDNSIEYKKPADSGEIFAVMYLVDKDDYESHKDRGFTNEELKNLEEYDGSDWTNKYIYIDVKYHANEYDTVVYGKANNNQTTEISINEETNKKYFFVLPSVANEGNVDWTITATNTEEKIDAAKTSVITKIDITKPPKPTLINSSNEKWVNDDVVIDATSKDTLSGTDHLEYSINGTNWYTNWQESTKETGKYTWDNSTNRNITMYVRAVDNAGNIGDSSDTVIKIDIVKPPTITLSSTTTSWTNKDVTVTAKAADNTSGSGIKLIQYSTDNSTWSTLVNSSSGSKKYTSTINTNFYVRAIDNAGNISVAKSTVIKIDKIKPNSPKISNFTFNSNVTSSRNNCSGKGGTQNNVSCYVCILFKAKKAYDFSAKRSITDSGGSGLNSSKKQNTWNHNGNATKYTSWVVLPSNFGWRATNNYYLSYIWIDFGERGVDNAGNVGYSTIIQYRIYDSTKTSSYNACVKNYI